MITTEAITKNNEVSKDVNVLNVVPEVQEVKEVKETKDVTNITIQVEPTVPPVLFTESDYQVIIDTKGKFTNQQIVFAANNPVLENMVIQGLLPYITHVVHAQCSNKRHFFGMGVYETEADLIGDSLERALICIRGFKPKENSDKYAFYNYMSTALEHAIVQKINRDYRPLFRGKSNCWLQNRETPEQVATFTEDGSLKAEQEDEETIPTKVRDYMPFRKIIKRCNTEDEENLENDDGADQIAEKEKRITFAGVKFKAHEIPMLVNSYIQAAKNNGLLTDHELKVVDCLLANFEEPDKVIAEKLKISKQRVEQYRKIIALKLQRIINRENELDAIHNF